MFFTDPVHNHVPPVAGSSSGGGGGSHHQIFRLRWIFFFSGEHLHVSRGGLGAKDGRVAALRGGFGDLAAVQAVVGAWSLQEVRLIEGRRER